MKTILFLIRIGSICFIGFWTIAGFFALVIATNVNSAYWDMPNEPIFFGINNTLFFLIFRFLSPCEYISHLDNL